MISKLGMMHQGEELYKVYVNYDPGMTLILKKLANILKICDSEKNWTPGASNIHVYYHIQRSSPLKPLGQSKPNFILKNL